MITTSCHKKNNMDIMSQFNLPKYLKGKTFAEASKALDDKFKDRNDTESISTMNELQERLRKAQEFVKKQQEMNSKPSVDFKKGGELEHSSSYNEGGEIITEGPGVGSIMGAATGAMKLVDMLENNNVDTSGRTSAEYTDRLGNTAQGALSGAKVGGAIVPGLGHAIGAIGGGLIGGLSGPSDKDVTKAKANNLYASMKSSRVQGSNVAKFGLDLSFLDDLPKDVDFMAMNDSEMIDENLGKPLATPRVKAMDLSGISAGIDSLSEKSPGSVMDMSGIEAAGLYNPLDEHQELGAGSFGAKAKNPSFSDKVRFGANKILSPENLRYAPAAMNISQLSNLEQPKDIAFGRSNRKYQQQLVDEQGLQNTVRQATASNRDAILSSAGGSSSKGRAALLASQLQGTKALSQAYQQAGAENRGEARAAQSFDQATEKFNIGQADKAKLTNLQRNAAYQTNRSKLLSQIGQDLGGIGQEELFKKYPELAGLGYDSKGRKIKK